MSTNNLVFLSNVRLSFPHIAEPQVNQKVEKGVPVSRQTWSADFIMPEDHQGYQAFIQKAYQLAAEKWKENTQVIIQQVIEPDKKNRCYGDGATKLNSKTLLPYDGYTGNKYIAGNANKMPQIIDANGKGVDPSDTMQAIQLARKFYGGCWVNVALKPWIQENSYGRAIRADLVSIQFARDDTPFGKGVTDGSTLFTPVAQAPAVPAPSVAMPQTPFGQVSPSPFGQV